MPSAALGAAVCPGQQRVSGKQTSTKGCLLRALIEQGDRSVRRIGVIRISAVPSDRDQHSAQLMSVCI